MCILVVMAGGAWYGFKEFYRKNKDLIDVKADVRTGALELIKDYESNDSAANKKYLGKVIEVTGIVKEVPKDDSGYYTVVLGDTSSRSTVRCAMDTAHQQDAANLPVGSSAILRGNCTGFNRDEMGIGSDVILNRSVIIRDKK